MIRIDVYRGAQLNKVLQTYNEDKSIPTTFLASDAITASVWEGQSNLAIFFPIADWFTGLNELTLTNGGSGYSSSPTVSIAGSATSSDATAYAIVVNGVITKLTVSDQGDGYTDDPVVTISDLTGTGATATATAVMGWQTGLVSIQFLAAQTVALDPDGIYRFQITATRGAVPTILVDGLLKILATPGTTVSSPPDLITLDYAEAALDEYGLTDSQRDFLPYLVSAASLAIRKQCKDRNFDQRIYTQFYPIALNGQVRLYQIPVQQVLRVQGNPQPALVISNSSSAVQAAQAYFTTTGQVGGYGVNAQTATGMTLAWVSSGVASSTSVDYTANMTIADLAVLINAVGSGWVAIPEINLGLWPVTELDGGFVGQGCASGASPSSGATFTVNLDLAGCYLDPPGSEFLTISQSFGGVGPSWGPGWQEFSSGYGRRSGNVKVTYIAGELLIPSEVQTWCVELIKWKLTLLKTDLLLTSETAADYSYTLGMQMIAGMPKYIKEGLSPWIIRYA